MFLSVSEISSERNVRQIKAVWTASGGHTRVSDKTGDLSGRDVDNALLKLSGITIEDGGDESRLKPRKCPRCDTMNSPDSKYCRNCSLVLDVKAALELEEFS